MASLIIPNEIFSRFKLYQNIHGKFELGHHIVEWISGHTARLDSKFNVNIRQEGLSCSCD